MTVSPSTVPGRAPALDLPSERRVQLVVGPGGVGKTTVAAALAVRAAEVGRRTIVVTIDPSRRLAQALGIDHIGAAGEIVRLPHVGRGLDCLLLDTARTFETIVRHHSPDMAAAEAMLRNPIYRAMVRYLGGALEYAATAQVHMIHAEGKYDLIVLDTPPTANAIEFLEAPSRIAEVASNPAAKFLAQSGRIGMRFLGLGSGIMLKALEAVGGGAFVGDLGRFLGDFGAVLTEFQRRAGAFADLMTSPSTGVVLATTSNAFSVREALSFLAVLADRRLRIDGVVLNRFDEPPPPWPGDEAVLAAIVGGDRTQLEALRSTHAMLELLATRARTGKDELHDHWPGTPICVVPRVDPPPTTLEELSEIGRRVWPDVRR
jgi:anion-transporting  ArsA/GET3 family ATPase